MYVCVVDVDSDVVLSPPEDSDHQDSTMELEEDRQEVVGASMCWERERRREVQREGGKEGGEGEREREVGSHGVPDTRGFYKLKES